MDIEDWYHLDYFDKRSCDTSQSMLDGIEHYLSFLSKHNIPSTFFILGELAKFVAKNFCLTNDGHEVASHGWGHQRPLTMSLKEFVLDLNNSKSEIENHFNKQVIGYRAPCFSMNREYLENVSSCDYSYDSSRILFDSHPLYGTLDINGFQRVNSEVFRSNNFFEFQVSTVRFIGKNIPVSGGGYLRIFPWLLMKKLLRKYLFNHSLYVLYIHPFEFSRKSIPVLPRNTKYLTERRFKMGLTNVEKKMDKLVEMLKDKGFIFTTFKELRNSYMSGC